MRRGPSGQAVRVAGVVAPGSIVKEQDGVGLRFRVKDSTGALPVVYSGGQVPDIFRDDVVFPQGTLHLVTTNLDFAFNVIPSSCRFTASVQQTTEIAGGTGLFADASGSGAGGVVAHGTATQAADGACDLLAPTPHEVDRISSTGTLSY